MDDDNYRKTTDVTNEVMFEIEQDMDTLLAFTGSGISSTFSAIVDCPIYIRAHVTNDTSL